MRWIINNQLGRRNLEPLQWAALVGRRHKLEQQQGERTDLTSSDFPTKLATADRLAEEYHVSRDTVIANGQFVQGLDELKKVREDLPTSMLTKQSQRGARGRWRPRPRRGSRGRGSPRRQEPVFFYCLSLTS